MCDGHTFTAFAFYLVLLMLFVVVLKSGPNVDNGLGGERRRNTFHIVV